MPGCCQTQPAGASSASASRQAKKDDCDSLYAGFTSGLDGPNFPRMIHLWCNGQWFDPLDFSASPTDRGLILGLGLFETILAIDGQPVLAELHLSRLHASCKQLGWHFEFPDIRKTMAELLQRNQFTTGRARIRLAISAGSGVIHDLALGSDHNIWMTATQAADPPPSTSVNLSRWRRNEHSALAGLKCASYAENLVALEHAVRLGFEETIFLNTAGNVSEAATSNVFLVKNGTLQTPSLASGCLPGITRSVVIQMAEILGIPCAERDIKEEDLHQADELFLTSSIRGVMAISRFEQRSFTPGPVSRLLCKAWNDALTHKITT